MTSFSGLSGSRTVERGSRAAGLTLLELMVTIAVVGIIVTAAVAAIGTDGPTPTDAANRLANLLRETSRKAVAGGAVRADVAQALSETSRTQLRLDHDGDRQIAVIERLEEHPTDPTATWVELQTVYVPAGVVIAGHTAAAKVTESGLTPDIAFGASDTVFIQCEPSGACDAVTIYLHAANDPDVETRVANLRFSGPVVLDSW